MNAQRKLYTCTTCSALVVKYMHGTNMQCNFWYSTILPEMARVRQPHPSNTYSTIDDVEVPTDSIALELNPAYDAAEGGPALSHNLGTEAVSLNEGVVTFETPRDGRGVDEEIDRAECRMEDEEEDVTYYTPMDADARVDEGVHSRAENGRIMAENEGDFNWELPHLMKRMEVVGENALWVKMWKGIQMKRIAHTLHTYNILLSSQ